MKASAFQQHQLGMLDSSTAGSDRMPHSKDLAITCSCVDPLVFPTHLLRKVCTHRSALPSNLDFSSFIFSVTALAVLQILQLSLNYNKTFAKSGS